MACISPRYVRHQSGCVAPASIATCPWSCLARPSSFVRKRLLYIIGIGRAENNLIHKQIMPRAHPSLSPVILNELKLQITPDTSSQSCEHIGSPTRNSWFTWMSCYFWRSRCVVGAPDSIGKNLKSSKIEEKSQCIEFLASPLRVGLARANYITPQRRQVAGSGRPNGVKGERNYLCYCT